MNLVIWVVIGALIGWTASSVMRTNRRQTLLLNVVLGTFGAALGGWFLRPLFGYSSIDQDIFSWPGLMVALLGAVVFLAGVNLVRRAFRIGQSNPSEHNR